MTALMYHDVVAEGAEDTSGFPGRDAALYKVTPERFAAHVTAITRARPTQPSFPDPPNPSDPRDPHNLVISFDDGGVTAMRAADILEAHGLRGHFFVTTNYIGTRGFVTEDQIRALAERGHVVGSHSCSHPLRMGHCSWTQLLDEWARSCGILGDILGAPVSVASVPGGDFAPQVAEAAARAGITQLFTSEPTDETRHAFGLRLFGRYTIQRWTTAETAAALAAGEWIAAMRQAVVWNAKKMTKRLGGERYLQIRKMLIGHGDEVTWGDTR
jgi:peptidoglycan/xylan/chitin deacetylase (PgdA/CDA1 family)